MSTQYLVQNPIDGEFFSSFYYSGDVATIPVLFGAEEFQTKEEAFDFKNSDERLKDFIVVARISEIKISEVSLSDKEYQPHEKRVIDEQIELQEKLYALGKFIDSDQPKFIDSANWTLLHKQYRAMSDYNEILKQRIKFFK